MPAIVFDACGRMVIGGRVVKLESVYQLISPTLATQSHSAVRTPAAAAAAKGHPILAVQQTHSRAPPTAYASL